ncbi:MAG: hypothetical protein KAU28_09850, partial [Phycisphaerae bacterium]|nr:hypothetical protein [Phycisphaerae bacterium]
MSNRCLAALLGALMLLGCEPPPAPREEVGYDLESLPAQQRKVYPETAGGLFVCLADFEDAADGRRGFEQVESFSISPDGPAARHRFVVNITRTGAGAMEVSLPAGAGLVFTIPHFHNFTGYTLLSMSLYSRSVRDDLRVTLTTRGASWHSPPALLKPGWNTIMVDLQRLAGLQGFDITDVRTMRLAFTEASAAVEFNLDDIMLINNYRRIGRTAKGIAVIKGGLDYRISLPYHSQPLALAQQADGLWRFGGSQPVMQLAAGARLPTASGPEQLTLLGPRKVGLVEIVENNPIRLRLVNTWYFPTRPGEWLSLAVRQIRWENTFYPDGRWVTHVELNNAGGTKIGAVRIVLPQPVAWAGGVVSTRRTTKRFAGPVGRWNYLFSPPGEPGRTLQKNYLNPARVVKAIATEGKFAPGDADRDGFDESQ